jgi:hypothetical protein
VNRTLTAPSVALQPAGFIFRAKGAGAEGRRQMIQLQSTATIASPGAAFADPDWRGDQDADGEPTVSLRPLASLADQERRIEDWIRGGSCYGWLNAYQARRAAFELQSIRVQRGRDPMGAGCRRAIQSRLDRLDEVIGQARLSARP